jgi:hypothetical protein
MKILNYPSSGSYQGITSSRNRFGQYIRSRAIPVNPNTTFQANVRARMADLVQNYRLLTAAQRSGWADLGGQMVRTDSLGQTYTLTGAQAYVSVNGENQAAGNVNVADAPALIEPDPIILGVLTLTAASFSHAFTPTPLGAAERIFYWASPQVSAGKSYMGDYRLIFVGAAASASPAVVLTGYSARFGAPVAGNRIFVSAARYAGGFLSERTLLNQVVA